LLDLSQQPDLMLRRPGRNREMVDILSLALHHDEQAVLRAVEMALEAGGERPEPVRFCCSLTR